MKLLRKFTFLPTLLVCIVIAYLSLDEDPINMRGVRLFAGADKVVHGCMYLGLVCVGCYDIYRTCRRFTGWSLSLMTAGAIAWGGLMECMQGCMGLGRSADWYDFLANSCGAVLGLALGYVLVPYLFRRYGGTRLFHFVDEVL